jgi:hypothetical protein
MMGTLLRFFSASVAGFLLLLGETSWAQNEVSAEAVLEETQVAVGITTYLQLVVQGGQPEEVPNEIKAPGLTIGDPSRPPASNYAHSTLNGVLTVQSKYLYPVVGNTAGTFSIPAINLRIRGKEVSTAPLSIEIVKLSGSRPQFNSSQPYFLTFQASKTEAYVNELIPIELGLYVRGNNSIARPGRPKFEKSGKFVIKPFPTTYRLNPEQIDGIPFSNVRFPTQVAALSPGTHVLGPASVETDIAKPGNGLFPKAMMRLSETRTISSNELSFTIKPLPENGRPASFQGAVGSFELEVTAKPLQLRAGDPLSIDIHVRGNGNFDSLNPPHLPETDGWRVYPVTKVENPDGTDSQTITYGQVVIPLRKQPSVPSLELAFFDPVKEEYVTLRSPAIPLNIIPDPAADPSSGGAVLNQIGFQGEELNDILFIHTSTPSWRPLASSLLTQPSFWAWQLIPFSALAGLAGGWAWRGWQIWQAEQRRRFERTLEKVRARSSQPLSRAQFYEIVLDYFERWRVKHPQLPANLSARSRESLDQMLQAGNSLLYAGATDSTGPASNQEKQEILSALAELESLAPIA